MIRRRWPCHWCTYGVQHLEMSVISVDLIFLASSCLILRSKKLSSYTSLHSANWLIHYSYMMILTDDPHCCSEIRLRGHVEHYLPPQCFPSNVRFTPVSQDFINSTMTHYQPRAASSRDVFQGGGVSLCVDIYHSYKWPIASGSPAAWLQQD